MGATLQYSGLLNGRVVSSKMPGATHICGQAILSNEMVNLLSVALSAVIGALTAKAFYQVMPSELPENNKPKAKGTRQQTLASFAGFQKHTARSTELKEAIKEGRFKK